MRLLVTGGCFYTDADTVRAVLARALARHPSLVLVVGDCPTGLDAGALWWATEHAGRPRPRPGRPGTRGRHPASGCPPAGAVNAGIKTGAVSDGSRACRLGVERGQLVWFP